MADKKNHKIGIKTLISLILVISIAFSATSCFEEEKPKPYKASDGKKTEVDKLNGGGKKDILKIEERFFITQINDIYTNFEDFKNRTILVEGLFGKLPTYDNSKKVPVVYRYGPGCCTNDAWGGFMLDYKGKFPPQEEWIEVKGKPYMEITDDGYKNLYLKVKSLKIKRPRGADTVKR